MDTDAQPPVVLFVDDEPSILSALRRLVRPQGYRVLLASGGAEGLALLAQEPVDVVVSDMRMPEMDGAAFLEKVHQSFPQVGRILLTGYADIQTTVAAVNLGQIQRYIAKPWDDRELLGAIEDSISRRRLALQNQALLALTARQNEELAALNEDLTKRVRARTQELEQVNAMLERSFSEAQENFLLSIQVFSGLMELREGGLVGYSRQVADLARRSARHLGLSQRQQEDLHIAGLLHEIGKIGLPDSLLHKPVSVMNADDLARYRRHPLNGEAALLPLAELQHVARLVRWQHERIDGHGFPDGLSAEALPLDAQVLSAVSDYCSALSGRLAEQRYSPAQAVQLIRGGAGTRYEHDVVEALQKALAEAPQDQAHERHLGAHEIQPGMVLSRDLITPKGTLLLAAGHVFDARMVRQIREFANREGAKLTFSVRIDEEAAKASAPVGPETSTPQAA
ncbi:response regulator [Roseateles sp. SL47]|uniref:HD domain-containing phosphohydrolase n=1 Tax=Roseateles sp. SL47 TaxID=2995138 RepID=UPI00227007B3|nr:HD domain-containing phosphohydrolase [Roseateles sp. SL47]WAC73059.1 response regulator [Roseateles sp. SL47]